MSSYQKINTVSNRKSKKQHTKHTKYSYPLRSSSILKESYDYDNIRNSIRSWDSYTSFIKTNWSNMMKLYETVSDMGTISQFNECTNIINQEIIPYLASPSLIKRDVYKRFNESSNPKVKSSLHSMLESLDRAIEADRLMNNYDMISKRFDINKFISSNILLEDSKTDTIYSICSLLDTYKLDLKPKFAITAETVLYGIYQTIGDNYDKYNGLDTKSILEDVLDYYLINYGVIHTDDFLDSISEACHKDPFIRDQLDSRINTLRNLYHDTYDIPLKESSPLADDALYGMCNNVDQYQWIRDRIHIPIRESFDDLLDKFKSFVDKAKMAPSSAITNIKSGLSALFVPCRAEDLAKGTKNALATAFYAATTLGLFVVGGPLMGVFGMIANYTLSKYAQKEYLKDCISEWKHHRESVMRKIANTDDAVKKRKMQDYLRELDQSMKRLEDKYEQIRDKSIDELRTNTSQPQTKHPQQMVNI